MSNQQQGGEPPPFWELVGLIATIAASAATAAAIIVLAGDQGLGGSTGATRHDQPGGWLGRLLN